MIRALAGFAFATLAFAGAAQGGDYAYESDDIRPYYAGALPDCGAPQVLGRIAEKFAYADRHVTFTGLAIEHIGEVRESKLDGGPPGLIDRRYCRATAWMSDGQKSDVAYLIESKQGFASLGWNVESCLPKFDRWRVYDGWCRSIRP